MNAETRDPPTDAPDHFICVDCGHEKGAHRRKDGKMDRCWHRPPGDGKRVDWKAPACTCQRFR